MAVEEEIQVLEGELKLIKNELQQTLVSVRDFLIDIKVPTSRDELILMEQDALASGGSGSKIEVVTTNKSGDSSKNSTPEMNTPLPITGLSQTPPQMSNTQANTVVSPPAPHMNTADIPIKHRGLAGNPAEIKEESKIIPPENILMKTPEEKENIQKVGVAKMKTEETAKTVSQVNLLANLICWVSVARKEIGIEQLPEFLNIYSITGNLSLQMKDIILHLAEVTTDPITDLKSLNNTSLINEQIALCLNVNNLNGQLPSEIKESIQRLSELIIQQYTYTNKANIWSQLTLQLHGILAGEGGMLQSFPNPGKNKEIKNEESDREQILLEPAQNTGDNQPKDEDGKLAHLKLIVPVAKGADKEIDLGKFLINLNANLQNGNGKN